jgi:serine/threonine protein kinase
MKLKSMGINLMDIKPENLVYNETKQILQFIDFDRITFTGYNHNYYCDAKSGYNKDTYFYGTLVATSPLGVLLNSETTKNITLKRHDKIKKNTIFNGMTLDQLHNMEIISSDFWSLGFAMLEIICLEDTQEQKKIYEKLKQREELFLEPELRNFTDECRRKSLEAKESDDFTIDEDCKQIPESLLQENYAEFMKSYTKDLHNIIEKCEFKDYETKHKDELKKMMKILLTLDPYERWKNAEKLNNEMV